MKVREDIRKLTTTQTNMAKALGLTQPRINQLIEEGVIIRDEQDASGGVMIFRSLQNYFTAKAIANEDDEADFWKEKAKHERAKRELAELKLSKERNESYDAAEVEGTLLELFTDFRNKLIGLGHKLSPQLEGLPAAQMCAIIDAEVELALKELSNDDNGRTRDEFGTSSGDGGGEG